MAHRTLTNRLAQLNSPTSTWVQRTLTNPVGTAVPDHLMAQRTLTNRLAQRNSPTSWRNGP